MHLALTAGQHGDSNDWSAGVLGKPARILHKLGKRAALGIVGDTRKHRNRMAASGELGHEVIDAEVLGPKILAHHQDTQNARPSIVFAPDDPVHVISVAKNYTQYLVCYVRHAVVGNLAQSPFLAARLIS